MHTTRLDRNFDPVAVTNLANALRNKGSYAEALDLFQKLLEYGHRHLSRNHLDVAKTYNKYDLFFCPFSLLI